MLESTIQPILLSRMLVHPSRLLQRLLYRLKMGLQVHLEDLGLARLVDWDGRPVIGQARNGRLVYRQAIAVLEP